MGRFASFTLAVALIAGCSATPVVAPWSSTSEPATTPLVSAAITPSVTLGATPVASPEPSTPRASAISSTELVQVLDRERTQNLAPGMLAVVRHGANEVSGWAGWADTSGTPITDTTRFRIGSVTKPIVAALVLDAVEHGQFGLDDVVTDLVPGAIRPEPVTTVRQLLDHTSGVFDEGNEGDPAADIEQIGDATIRAEAEKLLADYRLGRADLLPDYVWIAAADTHARYFAPGSDYHYSNINYQLLAMILAKVTGQSLATLLQDRIDEPLGLTQTTLAPEDRSSPDMRGYLSIDSPAFEDVTDDIFWFGNGGNGGVISTAAELLTTMQSIVGGRLLSTAMTTQMKTPNLASYGLGLAQYALSCATYYGHEGSVLGTQTIALSSDDGADGVVVALNLVDNRDPQLLRLAERLVCDR